MRSEADNGSAPGEARWRYRLASFSRAYSRLREALEGDPEALSSLELEGLVRRFDYTFELGWKLLKDRLEHDGALLPTVTPRAVVRAAYEARLIEDGDAWMDMLTDRNRTSHMYDEDVISELVESIRDRYLTLFGRLHDQASAPSTASDGMPPR